MGNDARKWIPIGLIIATAVVTAFLVRDLPATVTIDLRGLLPFELEPKGDTAPRWAAVLLMPAIATVVWALFQAGRGAAGLRLARAFFRDIPDALADPATIDRIRATYDTMGLWVIVLILGVHAGMIAAALGHGTLAPRLVAVVMGLSIAAAGNVMPRLRPNLLAGVRTKATLTDPQLWRATHRVLGLAFVVAGAVTIVVGLMAPAYGLLTAVVALIVACVVAAIGGSRGRATAVVAMVLAIAARVVEAQAPTMRPVVELPAPASVVEERVLVERPGVTLDGTLTLPARHAGAVPIVLVVPGSGPTDRNANGPLINTNAYAMLAWQLADAGYASLRYDKRGIGASQPRSPGDPTTLTMRLFVDDVMAIVDQLASDKRFSRVYLLGHSEGAGHVLQAANRGTAAAGVIMVSGQGRPFAELLREQFGRQVDSATVVRIDSAFTRYLRGEPTGDIPTIAMPVMVPAYRNMMRSMAEYDPEAEARRVRTPLLILQGTTDVQVTMTDAKRLASAQPAAELVVLEGVNHVMKPVSTMDLRAQSESYRDPRLPLAPGVAEAIVRFIVGNR